METKRDSSPDSEPVFRRRPRPPIDLPPEEPFRKRAVPYVLVLAFAALLGLGSESIRHAEAIAAAAAFPIVVMVVGLGSLRHSATWLSRAAVIVALVVAGAADFLLYREFFPPAPLARLTLTPSAGDVPVPLPDSARQLEVVVKGKLLGDTGDARAAYAIDLQRGSQHARLEGEMTRHAAAGGRRMVATPGGGGGTATLESGRHEVLLEGPGPATARLASLGDGARKSLDLTVHPRPLGERAAAAGFAVLAALSFVLQAAAARKGIKSRLSGGVLVAGLFALYLRRYLDVADPLLTVLPAMAVSLGAGGLVGLLLGWVASRFAP